MNTKPYEELKDRQQKEFNSFPIAYAFNEKQLEEALARLGAKKEECTSVFGHGDMAYDVARKEHMRIAHEEWEII